MVHTWNIPRENRVFPVAPAGIGKNFARMDELLPAGHQIRYHLIYRSREGCCRDVEDSHLQNGEIFACPIENEQSPIPVGSLPAGNHLNAG